MIDESLTVQKVVALTLDRERYTITNAKTRSEAMKLVLESPPDLILISDQVAGVSAGAFPKEVETWVGRDRKQPALVLITGQDTKDSRGYRAVLKKPFAPAALQSAVSEALAGSEPVAAPTDDTDDMRLQKIFNDTFSDEAKLVAETYNAEVKNAEDTLINIPAPSRRAAALSQPEAPEGLQVLGAEDSMAYKAQLEKEVGRQIESFDLEEIVHRLIEKMVPPIVERVAQQRLDQLLKESESFVELKP